GTNRSSGDFKKGSIGRAFDNVRHLIDDSDWLDSTDNGEQLLELLSKPEYYGKEELESLYQAMHKLFYSDLRKDDDDLPAFRSRFEQAVRKVKKHKVELPSEALGFLFLKQSKIGAESFERLITMTNGDLRFDAVVDGLRRLKMKFLDGDEQETQEFSGDMAHDDDDIDLIEQAIADLDGDDTSKTAEVTEDGAREILMTLIKQKVNKPVSMTYKQVQQQKREVRNARGMIRAAVLEDTPDAPFLLSLPILKALDTALSLGHGNMHFQAIHESGKMFYNDKGQLCLKLFEFDAIAECSENSPDQWKVQKIIGDECQVFLLQHRNQIQASQRLRCPILDRVTQTMEEQTSSRGNKRACTSHAEASPKYVSQWSRMYNKLKIQEHLDTMVRLMIGLAIPLMNVLMRVLAMMMKVADMEEVDTLQEMMNHMVIEKKRHEKGMKESWMETPCYPKSKDRRSQKTSTTGNFSVISAENLDRLMTQSPRHQGPSSSSQSVRSQSSIELCYCGLKPVRYTCRKQGLNYMRQFYRCPKEPQSIHQCHYFQWIQETKGEEYERIYASSQGSRQPTGTPVRSRKHYEEGYASYGEPDVDSSPGQSQVIRSPTRSPPAPPRECNHQWNKRGTNAYQKMRTCMHCGLQEITIYKNNQTTQRWVDVTNLKKSGASMATLGLAKNFECSQCKEEEDNRTHHSMIGLGDVTLQKQARMRECAGRAFFSSECAAAIRMHFADFSQAFMQGDTLQR
ncbi:unnamed protein product, partial [Cladocopium goreaui]